MRKLLMILAVGCCLHAAAQGTVERIRQLYADMRQTISERGEDAYPEEYYRLNIVQNLPATGRHVEDVTMYFTDDEVDEVYPPHHLLFATVKYNFAVREFYEEYLFDDDGHLLFAYGRLPQDDATFRELRLYWNGDRLEHVIVKAQTPDSADFKVEYTGKRLRGEDEGMDAFYRECAEKLLVEFRAIDDATRH
jgi:hypothetical protein